MFNFTKTKIEKLTRTSCLTLLMAGTLLAQSGAAQTFKFSDFTFTRAATTPTSRFHNKVFYQTQTTNAKGKTVITDVKGVDAFQQFVLKEATAIDLNTLNARKLDPTKLKLKQALTEPLKIYFIDEGAGYRNQLKLVTTTGTNKDGLVFYDGSKGAGANELLAGDYVTVGNDINNSVPLQAGTTLDFQLRANGFDTSTNTSRVNADVWHTDKNKNVDNLQHVIAYEYQGFLVLAWEDLKNGGDKDYNDIVFAVDIGQANLDAIPDEPPVNQPPNAMPDTGNTNYGAPVTVDVLKNDIDPENKAPVPANQGLTITNASSLTGATVQVVNGQVKYTPAPDFNIAGGSDSFSYTIKDAQGLTGTATVTITVAPKPPSPKAPVAVNDSASTPNNTPVIIDVLNNDSDPENQGLNVPAYQGLTIDSVNSATGATVQIVNGKVKYIPVTNAVKRAGITDTFTYTVKDPQGLTGAATVTVNVGEQANKPPVAQPDEVFTPKKTPVTVNVMANDSDPDGDNFTLESVNSAIGATVQIDKVNGKVIYTPKFSANNATSESFTYTIKDTDGATAIGTVTVNVGANKAPDALDDKMSTDYGKPVTVDVLLNDTDPDDQDLIIKKVNSLSGAKVEVIDGKVMYTPKADFNIAGGTDTFTYTIEDIQGATDSATVTISVGEKPNGAPVAVDDVAQTPYGTSVTIDVMANDSDPDKGDGDSISIKGATSATGAIVNVDGGKVTYTPKTGFKKTGGADKFTYTIKDTKGHESSATVTVEVGKDGTAPEEELGKSKLPSISD